MSDTTPDFTNNSSGYDFEFFAYDTYNDLVRDGQIAFNQAIADGKRQEFDRTWFNEDRIIEGADFDLLNSGEFIDYVDKDALDRAMSSFETIFQKIDMGGAFEKSRLKFVERPGIFDFGLASKGLYTVKEFFSEELKKASPFEFPTELPGIVPNLYVNKNQFGDFWYTSLINGKKYQMTQQDKGQEAIDLNLPDAKKEYRTRTKKSYITFDKKRGKARYVDLYIPVAAAGSLYSSGMLARTMPLLIAAKYFEAAGIRVRIYGARTYTTSGSAIVCTWGIKDYGEPIDFNNIAIQTCDERFFRWNLWRFVQAFFIRDNKNISYAGNPVYGDDILNSMANRYKNWYFDEMKAGRKPQISIDRRLMIFAGLNPPPDSWHPNADFTDEESLNIIEEFYRILDIVDFQYNEPEAVVTRIVKRRKEAGMSIDLYNVRRYCVDMLQQAYSVATKGQYASTDSYIKTNDEEYQEKIEKMVKALQKLKL